jgi:hypothetical protein
VAEATLDLTISLLLLALGLLGIVVVVYLIYLVLAIVFQWKVRLPRCVGGRISPP